MLFAAPNGPRSQPASTNITLIHQPGARASPPHTWGTSGRQLIIPHFPFLTQHAGASLEWPLSSQVLFRMEGEVRGGLHLPDAIL